MAQNYLIDTFSNIAKKVRVTLLRYHRYRNSDVREFYKDLYTEKVQKTHLHDLINFNQHLLTPTSPIPTLEQHQLTSTSPIPTWTQNHH